MTSHLLLPTALAASIESHKSFSTKKKAKKKTAAKMIRSLFFCKAAGYRKCAIWTRHLVNLISRLKPRLFSNCGLGNQMQNFFVPHAPALLSRGVFVEASSFFEMFLHDLTSSESKTARRKYRKSSIRLRNCVLCAAVQCTRMSKGLNREKTTEYNLESHSSATQPHIFLHGDASFRPRGIMANDALSAA